MSTVINTSGPQWEPTGDTFIEQCDDRDCGKFHQYAIHTDAAGTTDRLLITDMDGDGDTEVDTYPETDKSTWYTYLQTVADTGDDYLGQLILPQSRREKWTISLANWMGAKEHGLMVTRGRRAGKAGVEPSRFPESVLSYLQAEKGKRFYTTTAVHSIAELRELAEVGGFTVWRGSSDLQMKITVDLDVRPSAPQHKRAVMKAARKQLRAIRRKVEQSQ